RVVQLHGGPGEDAQAAAAGGGGAGAGPVVGHRDVDQPDVAGEDVEAAAAAAGLVAGDGAAGHDEGGPGAVVGRARRAERAGVVREGDAVDRRRAGVVEAAAGAGGVAVEAAAEAAAADRQRAGVGDAAAGASGEVAGEGAVDERGGGVCEDGAAVA